MSTASLCAWPAHWLRHFVIVPPFAVVISFFWLVLLLPSPLLRLGPRRPVVIPPRSATTLLWRPCLLRRCLAPVPTLSVFLVLSRLIVVFGAWQLGLLVLVRVLVQDLLLARLWLKKKSGRRCRRENKDWWPWWRLVYHRYPRIPETKLNIDMTYIPSKHNEPALKLLVRHLRNLAQVGPPRRSSCRRRPLKHGPVADKHLYKVVFVKDARITLLSEWNNVRFERLDDDMIYV